MHLPARLRVGSSLLRTLLCAAILLPLLAACGSPAAAVDPGGDEGPERPLGAGRPDPSYLFTVSVDPGDTLEAIERRYGAEARIFVEGAFALLGSDQPVASDTLEQNRDLFLSGGARATMSGSSSAWAGGSSSAWAGGSSSAWAGGSSSAWAGGEYAWMPANTGLWNQVRLQQGHAIAGNLGHGVTVAVIDTGIDLEHPALREALAPVEQWWDFYGDDADPQEEGVLGEGGFGHGTNVAGIVRQVAPRATILPLRVLGPDGSGNLGDVAQAIHWAQKMGAQVINLSLGSDEEVRAIERVIDHVTRRGVFVIASTGNTGDTAVSYPAATATGGRLPERRLSVTSVDRDDLKSGFATFGEAVELAAPGEQVYGPAPGERMAAWSGTSMAAPMASGALALALGEALQIAEQELTAALAEQSLDLYANGSNAAYLDRIGGGRLDAERFLSWSVNGVRYDQPPSGLKLSNATVAENEPAGTVVGSFAATDIDSVDGFVYRLVAGAGDSGNGSFAIAGAELVTAASFDFESRANYSIRVRVEDAAGGAFEETFAVQVLDVAPDIVIVTTLADSGAGSLRQALIDAKPQDTVVFDSALIGGTITLTSGQIVLAQDVEIRGSVTISGDNRSRVFEVPSGVSAVLEGPVVTDGQDVAGGAVLNSGSLVLQGGTRILGSTAVGEGGGVYNRGSLTLQGTARIVGNTAGMGGGVFTSGTLTLLESARIDNNTASGSGGGVYTDLGGQVVVAGNSRIHNNYAGDEGGGVFNLGTVTLQEAATIRNNTSRNSGGGVHTKDGVLIGEDVDGIGSDNVSGNAPDQVYY